MSRELLLQQVLDTLNKGSYVVPAGELHKAIRAELAKPKSKPMTDDEIYQLSLIHI